VLAAFFIKTICSVLSKGASLSKKKTVAGGIGALSVLLTAGVTLAPAAVATTTKPVVSQGNSALALSAAGLLKIDAVPAVDDSAGFSQKSVAEFSLPGGVVKANVLNARAGAGQARASILDVSVNLSLLSGAHAKPLLTASAIEADCSAGKGSSSLAKATIGDKKLDVAVAPNTIVGVPGLASVMLNKQTTNKDGSVTIIAIEVNVDGIQKVDLASVTCAGDDGTDGATTESEKPTATSAPSAPTATKTTAPSKPTAVAVAEAGDKPDANGKAPVPTPVKAHLDVTG
jgi:hypothetical protein